MHSLIVVRINIRTNGKRQCSLALGLMHPFFRDV